MEVKAEIDGEACGDEADDRDAGEQGKVAEVGYAGDGLGLEAEDGGGSRGLDRIGAWFPGWRGKGSELGNFRAGG
jgi:hypothetical protein